MSSLKITHSKFIKLLPLIIFLFFGAIAEPIFISAYKNNMVPSPTSTQVLSLMTNVKNPTHKKSLHQFILQGMEYNPIKNLSYEADSTNITNDIQAIASTGATTIGLYNCGKFDWGGSIDITMGEDFCNKIYPLVATNGLKLIVGYFSNNSQDFKNPVTVARATSQFQNLVETTSTKPSILYYLIGNEVFETLPDDTSRIAYAQWIGDMVTWLQRIAPEKKIIYADNWPLLTAMPYLRKYAPGLSRYAINDYAWNNSADLISHIDTVKAKWPGIPVLLHEWGVDSFNVATWAEDQNAQETRIQYLLQEIEKAQMARPLAFEGALFFEYTDEWGKIGDPSKQDPDAGQPWTCNTCFDKKANEDFWGIKNKKAYDAFKNVWTY